MAIRVSLDERRRQRASKPSQVRELEIYGQIVVLPQEKPGGFILGLGDLKNNDLSFVGPFFLECLGPEIYDKFKKTCSEDDIQDLLELINEAYGDDLGESSASAILSKNTSES